MTVAEAIVKFGDKVFFKKAAKLAQENLYLDEEVIYAHECRAADESDETNVYSGDFVVTQRRAFFCSCGFGYRAIWEIPLEQIMSMQIKDRGATESSLKLQGFRNSFFLIGSNRLIGDFKYNIQVILDNLVTRTPAPAEPATPAAQPAPPAESAPDLESQLRALKRLLDEGILTQEEFDAKKKQVLGL